MKQHHFLAFFFIFCGAILYLATITPISPHEAEIFQSKQGLVAFLMQEGYALFSNFFGLRVYFIVFGFSTVLLFLLVARRYFMKESDAYVATIIFMFLPGVLTGTSLANIAIVVLPLVLLLIVFFQYGYRWFLALPMLALFFVHDAAIVLYVALLLYALVHKEHALGVLSTAFMAATLFLGGGLDVMNKPSGHFAEIFGLYGALFSPLLFVFYFYALYRVLLREEKHLIWYISFVALGSSLLLSIRQRIDIVDFSPYMLVGAVVVLDVYYKSLRVRLKVFRRNYQRGFGVVLFMLALSVGAIVFHKPFYEKYPDKHFARKVYQPYTLAKALKAKKVLCYDTHTVSTQAQLAFYGISPCIK